MKARERERAETSKLRGKNRSERRGSESAQKGSGSETARSNSGDDGKREPPVPIPNTEVKPLSAEGTWLATAREIRTPPDSTEGISNYPLDSN